MRYSTVSCFLHISATGTCYPSAFETLKEDKKLLRNDMAAIVCIDLPQRCLLLDGLAQVAG